MKLRKDRFLAAVFALSLGACGGDAEAETDTSDEATVGAEDPMMDDGMTDDGMTDDGMADDGMADDGMADDGMADDGMEDEGPLPE